jgi:hypothetical protein
MARLSQEKLAALKSAFIEQNMSPDDAAKKAGVSHATAVRYYGLWDSDIRKGRETQLMPQIEESIRRAKKRSKRG